MSLFQSNKKIDIKYSGLKTFGVFCLVLLLAISISTFGSTVAHYRDREVSSLNRFVSPPLSFDVLIDGKDSVEADLTNGEVVLMPVMTPHPDSLPIQYWVSAQVVGGDLGLCDAIDLVGTFPFPYNNRLNLLQTSTTTETGAWTNTFSIFDGAESHPNTFCTVDLIYRGSQDGTPFGDGYTDIQTVRINFTVGEMMAFRTLNSFVEETTGVLEEETEVEEEVKEEEIVEEETTEPEEVLEEETETLEEEVEEEVTEEEVVEETTTPEGETEE